MSTEGSRPAPARPAVSPTAFEDTRAQSLWPQTVRGTATAYSQQDLTGFDPRASERARLEAARRHRFRQWAWLVLLGLLWLPIAGMALLSMGSGYGWGWPTWPAALSWLLTGGLAVVMLWIAHTGPDLPRPAVRPTPAAPASPAQAEAGGTKDAAAASDEGSDADAARAAASHPSLPLALPLRVLTGALGSARALAQTDGARAARLLDDLIVLCRQGALQAGQSVSLAEEVVLAQRYISVEKVRFGERLKVHWEIDAKTHRARVPPLVLQPLLESALRHGLGAESGLLELRVRSLVRDSEAEFALSQVRPAPPEVTKATPDASSAEAAADGVTAPATNGPAPTGSAPSGPARTPPASPVRAPLQPRPAATAATSTVALAAAQASAAAAAVPPARPAREDSLSSDPFLKEAVELVRARLAQLHGTLGRCDTWQEDGLFQARVAVPL